MYEFLDNLSPMIQTLIVLLILILAIFSAKSPAVVDAFNKYIGYLRGRLNYNFSKIKDYDSLNVLLKTYGYSYDNEQDIFKSIHDAWQREMGYCRLYDEAAAPLSMIIDCEPIYFEYDNKRWLIEFWKGQYGMTTGCEIGVYYTDKEDIDVDGFKGAFYKCIEDDNLLSMSFSLIKDDKIIMKRRDKHWWLTGFILGEFSEPWDLVAYLNIKFPNSSMRNEFVKGLINAGYLKEEIVILKNSVSLKFNKPRTPQPYTRIKELDELTQKKNKLLCDRYLYITSDYDNIIDKIHAVQKLEPELLEKILLMGKTKPLFSDFINIKDHIE